MEEKRYVQERGGGGFKETEVVVTSKGTTSRGVKVYEAASEGAVVLGKAKGPRGREGSRREQRRRERREGMGGGL